MVRPNRNRTIRFNPDVTYYKPAGVPMRELEEEVLGMDEIEAIRLCDEQGMKQEEASNKMKISQSTLFRILKNARKKIANALIKGKAIRIDKK
jgi:uncharacterized protein